MKCSTCNYCKVVYRRTGVRYWRGKEHYCAEQKKLVKTSDCCDMWQKRTTEYDLSENRFNSVQNDILKLIRNSEL